jgi:hypothetical protein
MGVDHRHSHHRSPDASAHYEPFEPWSSGPTTPVALDQRIITPSTSFAYPPYPPPSPLRSGIVCCPFGSPTSLLPTAPPYRRLVPDVWINITQFLAPTEIENLEWVCHYFADRIAKANGIWEWVILRDFTAPELKTAVTESIVPRSLASATQDDEFFNAYHRLRYVLAERNRHGAHGRAGLVVAERQRGAAIDKWCVLALLCNAALVALLTVFITVVLPSRTAGDVALDAQVPVWVASIGLVGAAYFFFVARSLIQSLVNIGLHTTTSCVACFLRDYFGSVPFWTVDFSCGQPKGDAPVFSTLDLAATSTHSSSRRSRRAAHAVRVSSSSDEVDESGDGSFNDAGSRSAASDINSFVQYVIAGHAFKLACFKRAPVVLDIHVSTFAPPQPPQRRRRSSVAPPPCQSNGGPRTPHHSRSAAAEDWTAADLLVKQADTSVGSQPACKISVEGGSCIRHLHSPGATLVFAVFLVHGFVTFGCACARQIIRVRVVRSDRSGTAGSSVSTAAT